MSLDRDSILLEVRSDVKQIISEINEIKVLDGIQNAQLAEHMRRSDLNEQQVHLLSAQLEPIKSHVNRIQGALQLVGLIGTLIAITVGIYKLIGA